MEIDDEKGKLDGEKEEHGYNDIGRRGTAFSKD